MPLRCSRLYFHSFSCVETRFIRDHLEDIVIYKWIMKVSEFRKCPYSCYRNTPYFLFLCRCKKLQFVPFWNLVWKNIAHFYLRKIDRQIGKSIFVVMNALSAKYWKVINILNLWIFITKQMLFVLGNAFKIKFHFNAVIELPCFYFIYLFVLYFYKNLATWHIYENFKWIL